MITVHAISAGIVAILFVRMIWSVERSLDRIAVAHERIALVSEVAAIRVVQRLEEENRR